MKRRLLLLPAILLLSCMPAGAQTITSVTGTIVDPNGVPFTGGTVKAVISPPGVTSPIVTATNSPVIVPVTASIGANGSFSMALVANASITPGGTQWTFTFCSPPVSPPLGTGAGCFTSSAITIAGASQDISTTVNPSAPALLTPFNSQRTGTNDQTGLAANVAATTVFTAPAQGVTRYRISCYVVVTQAATTSSTLPACNVVFTDSDNNTGQTLAITATNTGNTLTTLAQGTANISARLGTVIQVSTTGYASVGATAMNYALHFKIEQMGN